MLRDALKVELQRGQMKLVKGFVKTCYSEVLISENSNAADNEHEDGSLITDENDGSTHEVSYHGGLGLKFKFPGDPKKYVPFLVLTYVSRETRRQRQKVSVMYMHKMATNHTVHRLREASKIKLWTTYLRSRSPPSKSSLRKLND